MEEKITLELTRQQAVTVMVTLGGLRGLNNGPVGDTRAVVGELSARLGLKIGDPEYRRVQDLRTGVLRFASYPPVPPTLASLDERLAKLERA